MSALIQPFSLLSASFGIEFPHEPNLLKGSFSTITCHMGTVLGEDHITRHISHLAALPANLVSAFSGVTLADMEH